MAVLGREEGLDQGDAARAGRHDPVREADVVLEYLMLYVHVIHMHMHMHMHMHKHGRAGLYPYATCYTYHLPRGSG